MCYVTQVGIESPYRVASLERLGEPRNFISAGDYEPRILESSGTRFVPLTSVSQLQSLI
jgi:hypothetical protein